MTTPSDADQAYIKQALEYDPDTGDLRWRVAPSPRVMPGDMAGSWVARDKRLVVSIRGRALPATSIAWFLGYGRWPRGLIRIEPNEDRDPMTVPLADLYLASDRYSANPFAIGMRDYRARRRAIEATESKVRGVKWRAVTQLWECTAPDNINTIYASFQRKADAERYQQRLLDTLAWLQQNPPDIRPGDEKLLALDLDSGLTEKQIQFTLTLAEAKATFANGPHGLVSRAPPRPGAPVGAPQKGLTTDRLMLRYRTRLYPAASVAWFIASNGDWPRRKSVIFKDGDHTNLRIDNLSLRHAA